MNFSQYILRQKNILRQNHVGEEYLIIKGEVIAIRSADEVLSEISSSDGLYNYAEKKEFQCA